MAKITFQGVCVEVNAPTPDNSPATLAILTDLNLSFIEQRISIIGANGSGKSTFARLINGLRQPTLGTIMVDGLNVAQDGAAVRRRVGFMFSDPAAQTVMPTPLEDISLSLRYAGVARRDQEIRALEILERFGLADQARSSVYTLSGGQRQLLALAAVLSVEPEIIICDEPTTLLDLRNTLEISAALVGLPQQLIIATHDLDLAQTAQRTIVLHHGRVAMDAPPSRAVPFYRDLMQQEIAAPGSAT